MAAAPKIKSTCAVIVRLPEPDAAGNTHLRLVNMAKDKDGVSQPNLFRGSLGTMKQNEKGFNEFDYTKGAAEFYGKVNKGGLMVTRHDGPKQNPHVGQFSFVKEGQFGPELSGSWNANGLVKREVEIEGGKKVQNLEAGKGNRAVSARVGGDDPMIVLVVMKSAPAKTGPKVPAVDGPSIS